MDLVVAVKGMLEAEEKLRSSEGIGNPMYMSRQMAILSQFTGAVEERLAEYEKDLEITSAQKLHEYMITNHMKVTEAQRLVEIDIAERKGQVKYLTRLVASAWRQVGVIQSRINHLVREAGTQI